MDLPDGLPVVVAHPEAPGYVRTMDAHWDDLERSLRVQENAIDGMVEEVGRYAEALDGLRPYMKDHPFRTVAEALTVMQRESKR